MEEEEEIDDSSAELSISKDNPEIHSRLVKEIEKMLKTLMIDYNESIIIQMNLQDKINIRMKLLQIAKA